MSLKQQDLLLPDEEYVSYDVESLFTNVARIASIFTEEIPTIK